MHSGGKTIQLNAGHYQAKIVTVGAGLAELTHHGRHVVIPHKPEENTHGASGESIDSLAKSRDKWLLLL